MTKKILVSGANGLLGQHLVERLLQENQRVVAIGKGPSRHNYTSEDLVYYSADITDDQIVHAIVEKERPDTVVHAAAMTQVDECELHPDQCEAVNVRATAQLLLSAEAFSAHFIYISTDFVFDGEKGSYKETDGLNPVSWYGFTKMQAESIVETSDIPFAILRTCLVFGHSAAGTRSNIIEWVKKSLDAGTAIQVVTDQWRRPTYVEDLVNGVWLVIQQSATGTYHISGKDFMTPYDMALTTAQVCGLDTSLIQQTDAGKFSQPARRPPKTGFVITKAQQELGYEPMAFADAIKKMFRSSESR